MFRTSLRHVIDKIGFLSTGAALLLALQAGLAYGGNATVKKNVSGSQAPFPGTGLCAISSTSPTTSSACVTSITSAGVSLTSDQTTWFKFTAAAGYGVLNSSFSVTNGANTSALTCNSTDHSSSSYRNVCIFRTDTPANNATMTVNATFTQLQTVTANVVSGASTGTIAPATSYWLQGESPLLTLTPATNYMIQSVTDTLSKGSLTGNTYNITNLTGDDTVTANFTTYWTITPSISGSTGTISPALPATVPDGNDSSTFLITAAAGSIISDVIIDGTHLGAQDTPYTYPGFTAVHANHTIQAVFTTPPNTIMNYCNRPAFLSQTLKPNLLIMLDNSASMYDLAYIKPPSGTPGSASYVSNYCYDDSFAPTGTYYGYFAQGKSYRYNFSTNKFAEGTEPGTCTYRGTSGGSDYFCVVTDGATPPNVTSFWAKANFLNWLSASKLDQQKQILTGGKYDAANLMLTGESRGCVGRRYVKVDPTVAGISFGVRGPNSYDSDYTNMATQGGGTRIEIFNAQLSSTQKDACMNAVNEWTCPGSIGDVQSGGTNSNTDVCMSGANANLKTTAYNHVTHLCYRALTGGNLQGEINTLQNDCVNVYSTYYGGNPALITNETAGDLVCASRFNHLPVDYSGVTDTVGYLGQCYNRLAGTWDAVAGCSQRQIYDYCIAAHTYDVTDPSNTSQATTCTAGLVPSFIMDAALSSLGSPIATMNANVSLVTPPTHLLQEFKDVINYGAMQYNYTGASTSECTTSNTGTTANIKCAMACKVTATNAFTSQQCFVTSDCPTGQTCAELPQPDGAVISAYLDYTPLGDHATAGSLIYNIDNIQANSWTPLAEAFYNAIGYFGNRSDMHLNSALDSTGAYDYDSSGTKNPSQYICRQNYTLLITDGGSTADQNTAVNTLATAHQTSSSTVGNCTGPYKGSKNLADLVKLANTKKIQDTAWTTAPTHNNENITTYAVLTTSDPVGSTDYCTAPGLIDAAASNGGTGRTSAYRGGDYTSLETSLRTVFSEVASRITSGTAASILSNSQGSGANILQAIFYPVKSFDNLVHSANWIGELQNFWYYIDPFIGNSTIREDTDGDLHLNLVSDYEARFVFNTKTNQTEVQLFKDTNGDGMGDIPPLVSNDSRFYNYAGDPNNYTYTSADNVKALWRAGKTLWLRDGTSSNTTNPRLIFTQTAGTLQGFTSTSLDTSQAATRTLLQAGTQTEADNIISYIRGDDTVNNSKYRQRGLVIGGTSGVWKLGDIVDSTPRIQASNSLNTYDLSPPAGYKDTSYGLFTATSSYQNRGMAYVGANDGMLHAFKLGLLDVGQIDPTAVSGYQKAILKKGTSTSVALGEEEWAFIPKNALPYLKYFADPLYPHLYYVDGTPTIFDASIGRPTSPTCASGTNYWNCVKDTTGGTNWKTVLVQGMGLGGASRIKGTGCGGTTCVETPILDPADATNNTGLGYSSYFALDITNQTFNATTGEWAGTNPQLLWEFSDPELGYSTSGPAIVRIKATNSTGDDGKNGRWFAVFASGPTGPINSTTCQFQGSSDQNLKLFVLDLNNTTGSWTLGTNYWIIDTRVPLAFAGTITNGVIDADRWDKTSAGYYQDDAIYVGYVKQASNGTWTDGGVGRLLTKESLLPQGNADPSKDWAWSTVIDGIGAVTTTVGKLQDRKRHQLWLYFGTGRYLYNGDDMGTQRRIIAVKEKCYSKSVTDKIDPTCSDSDAIYGSLAGVPLPTLSNKTTDYSDALNVGEGDGWYVNLDARDYPVVNFGAERVTTDPVALTNGTVFFTTFKPSTDPCQFGGQSFMWGLKYDTGATPAAATLKGKALIQVSTGAFQELDLSQAFTANGNRRTGTTMQGKPPGDPPPVISNSNLKPIKKILHIQEK